MSELRDLIEKACTETITPSESERLNALLRGSEEMRRRCLDYLGIHARLAWEFGPRAPAVRPDVRRPARFGLAAAMALLLLVLAYVISHPESAPPTGAKFPAAIGRIEAVEILPAPAGLVVDGDLSDWGPEGRFRSVAADTAGRWVEGRMRYDATSLYVAARVGDPFALRNRTAAAGAATAWRGGALQLRLSTDRSKPWPVTADHLEIRRRDRRDARAEDTAGTIVHLTMWRQASSGRAHLHLAYGMDFDRDRVDPPGCQGAIRPDPTGPGYEIEYAIPWSVLNAGDAPPRGGDVLPLCWTLTWADETGTRPLGQLIDVLNPARTETDWIFMRASDWGKAVFR